jgi:hypothetical protein
VSLLKRFQGTMLGRLRKHPVVSLVRIACWIALVGLAVMAASIVYPVPLSIIFAMSVGQVIGIVAFLCYLLSIVMDVVRTSDQSAGTSESTQNFREPDSRHDVSGST